MSARPFLLICAGAHLSIGCAINPRMVDVEHVRPCENAEGVSPAREPLSLDLVTYNVAGLPHFVSRGDPRETHPKMGEPLGAFDLVLLQEDFWYHHLIDAPHPWRVRPRRGFLFQLGDGLARLSRHPLSAVEHTPWSSAHGITGHYNDRLAAKGFAAGTVEVAPAHLIWVYNVHFDAGGSNGDRRARERQRAQLSAHIDANVLPDAPLIVAGDFNCGPGQLQELCTGAALTDAGVGGIDRVLYRSGRNVGFTKSMLNCSAALDALRGLSDHAPVSVRFQVEVRSARGSAVPGQSTVGS